jgi:signal transduction histidine kinase
MDGRPTTWERLRRVDPRIWDAAIAVAVVAITLSDLLLERASGNSGWPEVLAVLAMLGASVPLYWRRRRPLATLVVVTAAAIVFVLSDQPAVQPVLGIPLGLAAYSAAAHMERSWRLAVAVLGAMATCAVVASDANANWVEMSVNGGLTVGVPVLIGRMVWNRRRRVERERDLAARDAVAVERARIARELHDVVAHSMSIMVVQAGAARSVLRRDADGAERALRSIEETGRTGLAEMRRLLAAEGDDASSLIPQPGLDRLDELLARMRATGLSVELVVEGEARPLPVGMDLSAYRIVQEALTNTLKHGGDRAHARVLLRYDDDAFEIEVTDDGRGPASTNDGAGRGLIGMRERVTLFGGDLRSGARPGGGFTVHARIPIGSEPGT